MSVKHYHYASPSTAEKETAKIKWTDFILMYQNNLKNKQHLAKQETIQIRQIN